MRTSILHMCMLFLTWATTHVTTMPYMHCTKPSIDVQSASNMIESMFDRLVLEDVGRAHQILDLAIKAASNPFFGHVMTITGPAQAHWQERIGHIRRCHEVQDYGFRSFATFGLLIQEHFKLLMSIAFQNRLLLCMMLSIYLYDVGEEGLDAAALVSCSDNRTATLLLKHAKDKGYQTWQRFLHYIE